LIRLFALFLATLMVFMPAGANAAPANGDLPLREPCLILGNPDADPDALIKGDPRFDCKRDPRTAEASTVWVRYDLTRHAIEGSTGWTYDHTVIQAHDEQVWLLYADGHIRRSPTAREDARRIFGGPTQRYDFPSEKGKVTALLVRIDGMENRRGPVPRASLTSNQRMLSDRAALNLGFGVMAGIMIGILFYNLTLYVALRYRMLLAYCGFIAAALFYGAIWSNAILWVVPGMNTATQFGWNAIAISLCLLTIVCYLHAFAERGMVSLRVTRSASFICGFAVLMSIARTFDAPFSWQLFDILTYGSFLAAISLIVLNCGIAIRRRSVAIRFFLLAWIVPMFVSIARVFWGLGHVRIESALFDASPFIALALEAMLSALGLSWRLRQLRSERDTAEDRASTYYELASADPLTGLLNRRAFLEQATGVEGPRSLLIIDIDHFKSINDTFGHDRGDAVLRLVAEGLRAVAPKDAIIGRLGGEEFAITCGAGAAETLGQQVRLAVSVAASWPDRHVTVSIGAATGMLHDYGDWRALYVLADKALYQSKQDGRDRVTISGQVAIAA
jgi:diguanylate cyclase (GGDEF)-like protein